MIKFKPRDLEECLMGLPIKNWQMIDDLDRTEDHSLNSQRPQMAVGHIRELSGIVKEDGRFVIKGYTSLNDILQSPKVPDFFKAVLQDAKNRFISKFDAFASYLSYVEFDCLIDPMLVALSTDIVLKSYMQERRMAVKSFLQSGNLQFNSKNELLYAVECDYREYSYHQARVISYQDYSTPATFSYFIGGGQDQGMIMTLMLPNRMVKVFDLTAVFGAYDHLEWREPYISHLRKIFDQIGQGLKSQLRQKNNLNRLFRDLIEEPIIGLVMHKQK